MATLTRPKKKESVKKKEIDEPRIEKRPPAVVARAVEPPPVVTRPSVENSLSHAREQERTEKIDIFENVSTEKPPDEMIANAVVIQENIIYNEEKEREIINSITNSSWMTNIATKAYPTIEENVGTLVGVPLANAPSLDEISVGVLSSASTTSLYPLLPEMVIKESPQAQVFTLSPTYEEIYKNIKDADLDVLVKEFSHRQDMLPDNEFFKKVFLYRQSEHKLQVALIESTLIQDHTLAMMKNVWTTSEKKVTEDAVCADGNVIEASESYSTATFHESIFNDFVKNQETFKYVNTHQLASYSFDRDISVANVYLEVEKTLNAISREIENQPSLQGKVASLSTFASDAITIRSPILEGAIEQLKNILDVLFFFERAITKAVGNGDVVIGANESNGIKEVNNGPQMLNNLRANGVIICKQCSNTLELSSLNFAISSIYCEKCGVVLETNLGDLTLKGGGAKAWSSWRYRFRLTIRSLLQRGGTLLLRVANLRDHMFILQQLIRTKGIGFDGWALPLLQFPSFAGEDLLVFWNDTLLDHYAAMLMVLLHPKCFEKTFYGKLNLAGSFTLPVDHLEWTVVDDDDDHDDENRSLNEDDIVALFEQFPHSYAFQYIFSHSSVFKCCTIPMLFARAKYILNILSKAINTYSGYKNLVKIFGRTITCLLVVSNDFLNRQEGGEKEATQPYFDDLVYASVISLLKPNEEGVQLYLSNIPYGCITPSFGWKVLKLLFFGKDMSGYDSSNIVSICPTYYRDWITNIHSNKSYVDQFCNDLMANISQGEYRLLGLSELGKTCKDIEISTAIVHELFHVAFRQSNACRDAFYRQAMDMIATIVNEKPILITKVIELINTHYKYIGKVSIVLFKKINVEIWKPTLSDLSLIIIWLNTVNDSGMRELAQYIIDSLCWGLQEEMDYTSPYDINFKLDSNLYLTSHIYHTAIGYAIIDSLIKEEALPQSSSVSKMGRSFLKVLTRSNSLPGGSFASWGWEKLLLLSFRNDLGDPWNSILIEFSKNDKLQLLWSKSLLTVNTVILKDFMAKYAKNANAPLNMDANSFFMSSSSCLLAYMLINSTDFVYTSDWLPLYLLMFNGKYDAVMQSIFNLAPSQVIASSRITLKSVPLPGLDDLLSDKDYEKRIALFKAGSVKAPSSFDVLMRIGDLNRRGILGKEDKDVLVKIILSSSSSSNYSMYSYCLYELDVRLDMLLKSIPDSVLQNFYKIPTLIHEMIAQEAVHPYISGLWEVVNTVVNVPPLSTSVTVNKITSLIEAHIILNYDREEKYGKSYESSSIMSKFWINEIQKKSMWETNANLRTVVDGLVKSAFIVSRLDNCGSLAVITSSLKHQFSLLVIESQLNSSFYPTLLPFESSFWSKKDYATVIPGCANFSFQSLLIETAVELPLWNAFGNIIAANSGSTIDKLRDSNVFLKELPRFGIDSSSLIASANFGHSDFKSLSQFRIYRWASYILSLENTVMILPLYWQLFFILYFSKSSSVSTVSQPFFGYKFLAREDSARTRRKGIIPEMIEKLKRLSLYYSELCKGEKESSILLHYNSLSSLYVAMSSWLSKGDPNVWCTPQIIRELPTSYDVPRLVSVLDSNLFVIGSSVSLKLNCLWLDLISPLDVNSSYKRAISWLPHRVVMLLSNDKKNKIKKANDKSAIQPVTSKLMFSSTIIKDPFNYIQLPPLVEVIYSLVQPRFGNSSFDKIRIPSGDIHSYLNVIQDTIHLFVNNVSSLEAYNISLQDLLHTQYKGEGKQLIIHKKCVLDAKCAGEGTLIVKWTETVLDNNVDLEINQRIKKIGDFRNFYDLFERRCQYESGISNLSTTVVTRMSFNYICAVLTIEEIVQEMISISLQKNSDSELKVQVSLEATKLFHTLLLAIDSLVKLHPPTLVFLTNCVKSLGAVFIEKNSNETVQILKTMLKENQKVPILSPLFYPGNIADRMFELYEIVFEALPRLEFQAASLIIKKFDFSLWLKTNPSSGQIKKLLTMCISVLKNPNFYNVSDREYISSIVLLHTDFIISIGNYSLNDNIIDLLATLLGSPIISNSRFEYSSAHESLWKRFVALPPRSWDSVTFESAQKIITNVNHFISQYRNFNGVSPLNRWFQYQMLDSFLKFVSIIIKLPCLRNTPLPSSFSSRSALLCNVLFELYHPWFSTEPQTTNANNNDSNNAKRRFTTSSADDESIAFVGDDILSTESERRRRHTSGDGAVNYASVSYRRSPSVINQPPWSVEEVEAAEMITRSFAHSIICINEILNFDGSSIQLAWNFYLDIIYSKSDHSNNPHVAKLVDNILIESIPWEFWKMDQYDLMSFQKVLTEPKSGYIPLRLFKKIIQSITWPSLPSYTKKSDFYSQLLSIILGIVCLHATGGGNIEQDQVTELISWITFDAKEDNSFKPLWSLISPSDYELVLSGSVELINSHLESKDREKTHLKGDDFIVKSVLAILEEASDIQLMQSISSKGDIIVASGDVSPRLKDAVERYIMYIQYLRSPLAHISKINSSISNIEISFPNRSKVPRLPLTPLSYAFRVNKGLELLVSSMDILINILGFKDGEDAIKRMLHEWLEFLNINGINLIPLPPGVMIIEPALLSWSNVEKSLVKQASDQGKGGAVDGKDLPPRDRTDSGGTLCISTFTTIGATFNAFVHRTSKMNKLFLMEAMLIVKDTETVVKLYEGAISASFSSGSSIDSIDFDFLASCSNHQLSLTIEEAANSGCFFYLYLVIKKQLRENKMGMTSTPLCLSTIDTLTRFIIKSALNLGVEFKFFAIVKAYFDLVLGILESFEISKKEDEKVLLSLKHSLREISGRLLDLSEDRIGDGLLAWVGLGARSTYSVEFRFVCRVLGTFIRGCTPKKGSQLSLHSSSSKALLLRRKHLKRLKNIETLLKSSEYNHLEKTVIWSLSVLKIDDCASIAYFRPLYKEIVIKIYPSYPFLL